MKAPGTVSMVGWKPAPQPRQSQEIAQGDRGGDAELESMVRGACAAFGDSGSALIEILHDVAARYGEIPEAALPVIALSLNLSRAEVYGAKSFYRDFNRSAGGRRVVEICLGEACRSCGSADLFKAVKPRLDEGGMAQVSAVYCLGNCALSPAIAVDGVTYGRIDDPAAVYRLVAGLEP